MEVSCWFGGPDKKTPAGYDIRIKPKDRERYFNKSWKSIIIELENDETIEVRVSPSFWEECIELRSAKIGRWLFKNGLATWPKQKVPHLDLQPSGERRFALRRK